MEWIWFDNVNPQVNLIKKIRSKLNFEWINYKINSLDQIKFYNNIFYMEINNKYKY